MAEKKQRKPKKNGAPRGVGRPRSYKTAAGLARRIDEYFASISRTVAMKDLAGNEIVNDAGEPVMFTEWLLPPTVPDLSLFLGIDRRTWLNYCDPELHPEFAEVTDRARLRLESYLVRESLTREKGLQGVTFNLENNYGYRQRREVELGEKTRKAAQVQSLTMAEKLALIREAAGEFGGEPDEEEAPADRDSGQSAARIPLPPLRGTFPPGEGLTGAEDG